MTLGLSARSMNTDIRSSILQPVVGWDMAAILLRRRFANAFIFSHKNQSNIAHRNAKSNPVGMGGQLYQVRLNTYNSGLSEQRVQRVRGGLRERSDPASARLRKGTPTERIREKF